MGEPDSNSNIRSSPGLKLFKAVFAVPGVIGNVGGCFGQRKVSIQSIVQFNASHAGAEIVVITHEVSQRQMDEALEAIQALPEVLGLAAHLGCL